MARRTAAAAPCLCIWAAAVAALLSSAQTVSSLQSSITVNNITHKYEISLFDKLFSSVPKRENALQDIDLSFVGRTRSDGGDSVCLLVGRSASGKSTLLRCLAGIERPSTQGHVVINGEKVDDSSVGRQEGVPFWAKMNSNKYRPGTKPFVKPIILESRPDFDDCKCVTDRVLDMGRMSLEKYSAGKQTPSLLEEREASLIKLTEDYLSLLSLSGSKRPSELSPSEQYSLTLACGCIMSLSPLIYEQKAVEEMHSPILLLDELFDSEHPSVVANCGKGLVNLVSAGAVVVSATHRPGHFAGISSRTVTLSGGKVLSDVKL
ncbi:hypothetical protein THAOC_36018 [Thalassiosira oceanica]|uniref:ABC transporter domain-containing protein n=2 Tax=Thalassiosira oceanica TaxID=159749 RepID=K0R2G0_THAOC|nr:hypothetical protein THAOC_36018 [Thalassiosira oceanica]|eukprot:EJK45369.1 hypothetical protein THAOC_36018 [Thalassiosira oceanica]